MIGKQFHYLTVIGEAPSKPRLGKHWLCRCRCGRERVARQFDLIYSVSKSCGCFNREHHNEKMRNLSNGSSPTTKRKMTNVEKESEERVRRPG